MAWWNTIGLGVPVDRPAGSLGATAVRVILFNVVGGEVLLKCMYFICTIAGGAGANLVEFDLTPTVGSALSPMDNGAGSINGAGIGDIMGPQGDITLPAVEAALGSGIPTFSMPWICKVGTIGVTKSGAFDAGTWVGRLFYTPLTDGAYVVAA